MCIPDVLPSFMMAAKIVKRLLHYCNTVQFSSFISHILIYIQCNLLLQSTAMATYPCAIKDVTRNKNIKRKKLHMCMGKYVFCLKVNSSYNQLQNNHVDLEFS